MKEWPEERIGLSIKQMAEAGFFYSGLCDIVTCFCCGVRLRNWQYQSDPFFEHAKFSPSCWFVAIHKGRDYATHVGQQLRKEFKKKPSKILPISDEDLNFLFHDFDILRHFMGPTGTNKEWRRFYYLPHVLKYLLKRKLQRTGAPYLQTSNLLDELNHFHELNHVLRLKNEMMNVISESLTGMSLNPTNQIPIQISNPNHNMCQMCSKRPVNVCFLPCKHFLLCANCVTNFVYGVCLFCQASIKDYFKVESTEKCQTCYARKSSICFLPCGHLQTCSMCAVTIIPNEIYPIKCPTCDMDSDCNFLV